MFDEDKDKLKKEGITYLRIKVISRASRTEVIDVMADKTIKIAVAAPPEHNKANLELIKFLAKELGYKKNSINIISGKTERLKLVKIVN